MRVTTSQLRSIIVAPQQFVASAWTAGQGSASFGNPQRQWMDASIRAYFAGGRRPEVLWQVFGQKVNSGTPSPWRRSRASGAVPMLEQFLVWDQSEPAGPVDTFPSARDTDWGDHTLALRLDLVYLIAEGYRVRQLWTDGSLSLSHGDAGLMAVGALVCADSLLGVGRTQDVEVWQLREGRRRTWNRQDLLAQVPGLRQRLDGIAVQLP